MKSVLSCEAQISQNVSVVPLQGFFEIASLRNISAHHNKCFVCACTIVKMCPDSERFWKARLNVTVNKNASERHSKQLCFQIHKCTQNIF